MGIFIFRVCRTLRRWHLLPWRIWSPVYDKWHRQAVKEGY